MSRQVSNTFLLKLIFGDKALSKNEETVNYVKIRKGKCFYKSSICTDVFYTSKAFI